MSQFNQTLDYEGYEKFLELRKKDLKRIAQHSRGVYQLGDVKGEILITAYDVAERTGISVDFEDPIQAERLISWTYQRLIRYCDNVLRYAESLDSEFDEELPSRIEKLTHGRQEDPSEIFEEAAESAEDFDPLCFQHSLGSVWIALVEQCSNRMTNIAFFLKLSLSHTYRCYNRVIQNAAVQNHFAFTFSDSSRPLPRPWRRTRFSRTPVQLVLDFGQALLFETEI